MFKKYLALFLFGSSIINASWGSFSRFASRFATSFAKNPRSLLTAGTGVGLGGLYLQTRNDNKALTDNNQSQESTIDTLSQETQNMNEVEADLAVQESEQRDRGLAEILSEENNSAETCKKENYLKSKIRGAYNRGRDNIQSNIKATNRAIYQSAPATTLRSWVFDNRIVNYFKSKSK